MRIDDSKIISKISKEQGVNYLEAEKAIEMFFKLIGKEIASGTEKVIEVKHLGKFTLKKPYIFHGTRDNNDSGRTTDI